MTESPTTPWLDRKGRPALLAMAALLLMGIYQTKYSLSQQEQRSAALSPQLYEEKTLGIVQIREEYEQQQKEKEQSKKSEESSEPRIVFVRVGQAGGTTIAHAFPRLECRKIRSNQISPSKLETCFRKRVREDSPLSSQLEMEVHLDKGRLPRDLGDFSTFMFSIRNPVKRAISSYSIFHHKNTDQIFARKGHHLERKFYKFCFPTLRHLLRSVQFISDPQLAIANRNKDMSEIPTEQSEYCTQMAYAVLRGKNPLVERINPHLHRNHKFFLDETVQKFPNKEVVAIRMESLWDDIKDLDVAMGGQGKFHNEGRNEAWDPDIWKSEETPTPEQSRDLCCILWEDIESYQAIVNRATNLDSKSKLQTLQGVWDSCGVNDQEKGQFQVDDDRIKGGKREGAVVFSWYKWHQAACLSKNWEHRQIDLSAPPPEALKPNS